MTEKEFILRMPKESKIDCLKAAIEEDFSIFLGLSRILLDAPLDQGGLETEVIEQIYKQSKFSDNEKSGDTILLEG
jgi:hypothetical protein